MVMRGWTMYQWSSAVSEMVNLRHMLQSSWSIFHVWNSSVLSSVDDVSETIDINTLEWSIAMTKNTANIFSNVLFHAVSRRIVRVTIILGVSKNLLVYVLCHWFDILVEHCWNTRPDFIEINGTIRCGDGVITVREKRIPFDMHWSVRQTIEEHFCRPFLSNMSPSAMLSTCHHENQSTDLCYEWNRCLSRTRIRDGWKNCLHGRDEEQETAVDIGENCAHVRRHRFRCSREQPSCPLVINTRSVKMDLTNCGSEGVEWFPQSDVMIKDKMNDFFFVNTLNNRWHQVQWRRRRPIFKTDRDYLFIFIVTLSTISDKDKMKISLNVNNGGSIPQINADVQQDNVSNDGGWTMANGIVQMFRMNTRNWVGGLHGHFNKHLSVISRIALTLFLHLATIPIHIFVFHLNQFNKGSSVSISVNSTMDTSIVREHKMNVTLFDIVLTRRRRRRMLNWILCVHRGTVVFRSFSIARPIWVPMPKSIRWWTLVWPATAIRKLFRSKWFRLFWWTMCETSSMQFQSPVFFRWRWIHVWSSKFLFSSSSSLSGIETILSEEKILDCSFLSIFWQCEHYPTQFPLHRSFPHLQLRWILLLLIASQQIHSVSPTLTRQFASSQDHSVCVLSIAMDIAVQLNMMHVSPLRVSMVDLLPRTSNSIE